MERIRQLQQVWNWLPAFRVVAETQHLPTASGQLGITPSALSRAIRDLEGQLGVTLFERHGRRIVLNARGEHFLAALRDSMRLLDDGLARVQGSTFKRWIRVAAPGPFAAAYVVPVLQRLRREHPEARASIASAAAAQAPAQLLEGSLDLAVVDDPVADSNVRVEKLIDLRYGVYCGPDHPLMGADHVTPETLSEYPFVGPPQGDDHWPIHWSRTVATHVNQLYLGMQICAQGEMLALLPDVVAQSYPGPGTLHRLPLEIPTAAALYLVRRHPLSSDSLVDMVAGELQAEIGAEQPGRT